MPEPQSSTVTYFVTSITSDRRPIFRDQNAAELLLETLQHYRQAGHYKLHAFVIMPDHVHLLLTPQDLTIERTMQFIKGGFSKRLGLKFPVWQKGFASRRMRDAEEFIARKEYTHFNPVRARIVEKPEDYPWSSATKNRTAAAKAEN